LKVMPEGQQALSIEPAWYPVYSILTDYYWPSFTVAITSEFTGTVGSSTVDDTILFGTVYDAIGVPDAVEDEASIYGEQLGGSDFSFTGSEPELIFRDGSMGELYAVNTSTESDVRDINANVVSSDGFTSNPRTTSFGELNPSFVGGGGGRFKAMLVQARSLARK